MTAMRNRVLVKQGSTRPTVLIRARASDGSPADLSMAAELTFSMRPATDGDADPITGPARLPNLADPSLIEYAFRPGDTDEPALYLGEFVARYRDGRKRIPLEGYIAVEVLPKARAAGGRRFALTMSDSTPIHG